MIQNQDLEIYNKTTKAYELIFRRNGVAVNITGYTIYFTCKQSMEDSDDNAEIKKDITSHFDATNGKTLIELSATDTDLIGSYHYDIKYKDEDDNADILFRGRINFMKPVTTRG